MKIKSGFSYVDVILISTAHHIHDIYTGFLAPVQMLLIENLGINHTLFGLLAVIQRIPTLFNPFIGILADKVRIRYLVIVSPSVTAVSMSLMGVAPGYIFLAILIFISGISSSLFHVPTPVMIKYVAGKLTGRGMSFYMVGGELARTFGPIVILGAVDLWGFKGSFRLIPMGIVASVILFIRFRNLDLRKDLAQRSSKINYKEIFKKFLPVFLIIIGITFMQGFMKSCLTYYLPGYIESSGQSRWIAGISLSAIYLSGTVGAFFSGSISDFIGRKRMLLIVTIISPTLMWIFIIFKGTMLFPILIIMGFFLLTTTPVILAFIHEFDTKHLAFVNGIYMTNNFLTSAITTLLTGIGFDRFGYELTFKFAACVAFLAIPFVLLINRKKN